LEKLLSNHKSQNKGGRIYAPIVVFLLTPKSVLAGTKNLRSKGFWRAKHTAHKHPHHDGAIFSSSGMVLLAKCTPALGASAEGVGQGPLQMV
jgi:hypothetical protein